MALTKQQKIDIIQKIKDIFKKSQSIVFVNFHGLSVVDTSEMRKELRNQNVGYTVVKKTLMKRALSDESFVGEEPALVGELALSYGEDLVAPASAVASFAKKHKDALSIIGGIFEGHYKNKEEMNVIAAIPPLPVLYGQFVNVINSPIQGLVVALGEISLKKN